MSKDRCTTCQAGMPTLSEAEITEKLQSLNDWAYDETQKCICRSFQFKGFYKTMAFANAIAWVAHTEKHHPDMHISYNTLQLNYTTHEADGVTKNDIICARMVDELYAAL
jgi:4a-hydroxytetrahydrobiopterin dehydratase